MPRPRSLLSLSLLVLGACAGTAMPKPPASSDEAAVRQARAAQNQAIAGRDLDGVASFWVEDVTVTAGLGTVLRGRAAYRRAFESDAALVYHRESEMVRASGNWAIAWEEGTWTGAREAGGTPLLAGRYSAQWVRQADGWRIRSELFVALECSGVGCNATLSAPR